MIDPAQLQQTLNLLEDAFGKDLQALRGAQELDALRAKYLGRKSVVAEHLKRLPEL